MIPENPQQRDVKAYYVPGKQVTLAHIIAHPAPSVCSAIGLEDVGAIGVLTLTPAETSIIAADMAMKSSAVEIGFLDRFSGTLIIHGSVGDVEEAIRTVLEVLEKDMDYEGCKISRY